MRPAAHSGKGMPLPSPRHPARLAAFLTLRGRQFGWTSGPMGGIPFEAPSALLGRLGEELDGLLPETTKSKAWMGRLLRPVSVAAGDLIGCTSWACGYAAGAAGVDITLARFVSMGTPDQDAWTTAF